MNEATQQKEIFRQVFLAKRNSQSPLIQKKHSQEITEKLKQELKRELKQDFLSQNNSKDKKKIIALFAGTQHEPDIKSLIKNFPEATFCFPKVATPQKGDKKGQMDFFEITSLAQLEKGFFDILEPKIHCKQISAKEIEIFCIPAVAIDAEGNRIGMGGGFYDRYLEKNHSAKKIGIIFPWQFSTEIFPKEKWDIPMDIIIQ